MDGIGLKPMGMSDEEDWRTARTCKSCDEKRKVVNPESLLVKIMRHTAD